MCPPELKQRHIAKTNESANPFPSSSVTTTTTTATTTTTTTTTTTATSTSTTPRQRKTLQDRKRIPFSIYLTVIVCLLLQFAAGVWDASTLVLWKDSMCMAWGKFLQHVYYLGKPPSSTTTTTSAQREYAQTVVLACLTLSVVYVFFLAPLKAGLWTGQRAKRHLVHRYGGLTYMLQYAAAWLEFGSQYNPSSNITHFISINGKNMGRRLASAHQALLLFLPLIAILPIALIAQVSCKASVLSFPSKCCRNWKTLDIFRIKQC
jgi:hypothetical protein